MGQPVSKQATTSPFPSPANPPFENYQAYNGPGPQSYGPPDYPPMQPDYPPEPDYPRRPHVLPRRADYAQALPPRRPQPPMMGPGEDFWEDGDNEPVYIPEGRRGRPQFDPFSDEAARRGYPPPPGGITKPRGYAGDLIEGMRPQRAHQYRSAPPQQRGQPNIQKFTSYVNEPRGYVPPARGGGGQSAGQSGGQGGAPSQVIYYDPATGAVTGAAGQQQQQTQQPISCPQQGCGQQPVQAYTMPQMGFPQMQQMGFPQMQQGQQGYMMQPMMMPQQQQQPIVIPGSLYTGNGGIQRLG